MRVLIAVDGSKQSMEAVKWVIQHTNWCRETPKIELVFVHLPLPYLGRVQSVVGACEVQRYYEDEGKTALASAKAALDASGIEYASHILIGSIADSIVNHAKSAGCDLIAITTRGMGAMANLMLGSTATKVLHLSDVPVLLVK